MSDDVRIKRNRYFLKFNDGPEEEVSMEEYVSAERNAGFRNTMGHPELPATASFGSSDRSGSVSGRTEYA